MNQDEGMEEDRSFEEGRGMRGDRRGGMNRFSGPSQPKPVKVGDEVDVKVEAVASKGDGIAKKDGFVIFVKDAKQGQSVKVKITEVRARFAIGELVGSAEQQPAEEEDVPEGGAE